MPTRNFRWLAGLVLLALVGCSALPFQLKFTPQSGTAIPGTALSPNPGSPQAVVPTSAPATSIATPLLTQPASRLILHLWLPPEFSLTAHSPASQVLLSRLEEYGVANSGLQLDVRVKDLEGDGGMLDSLAAASTAAPQALPDLVLLPRSLLESAAVKGLIYPLDGLTHLMEQPGWYDYANQLARIKNSLYGIPFAGDALALAYHPSMLQTVPADMDATLKLGQVMLIPAADPQAFFTFWLYLAKGKNLQDAVGRPSLDKTALIQVLEFYQQASQVGMMPNWLTEDSTETQVWEAFAGNQYPMAVTWSSTYLLHSLKNPADLSLAPLPASGGTPFTLATGWSWALAGQDPSRRMEAVKLAEFLADSQFMAQWASQAGYLPPRQEAIQSWPDEALRAVLDQISSSAQLAPPADLVASLGPALQRSVMDMLKAQSDPQTAAQAVIEQVSKP